MGAKPGKKFAEGCKYYIQRASHDDFPGEIEFSRRRKITETRRAVVRAKGMFMHSAALS
mgnify:CR=1 FL=1